MNDTPHSADLLVELGCEELPPKALDTIREAFFRSVCDGLEKNHFALDPGKSRSYSTPRRIALLLSGVGSSQPDQDLERRGPAAKAAFDANGKPTGAALGFARSVGREVGELETLKTDKGEWLYCRIRQAGKPLDELLYEILEQAIRQLPVPRPMRWAANDFSFIRPVHWLIVLHGDRVVPGRLFGLDAGRHTRGHRIHSPGPHVVANAQEYVGVLKEAFVLADQDDRREQIRKALTESVSTVRIDEGLLDEVNNLVEWPVAVAGEFEEEFLDVPQGALIASMQDHQKFFPVRESADHDRITNRFVAVSNIESRDETQVREGYERVIRPRLADARFFMEQDRQRDLDDYLPLLDRVIFQKQIGTVGDKSRRMSDLSGKLAEVLNGPIADSERAALLSKCDLMTQMVGEFPELQGLMGGFYAEHCGENETVSTAIEQHYSPRFAGDRIPQSDVGQIISIADRADTLVGIFAAGLKPSGNKDPFALRRAALGLLRILLEGRLDIELDTVLELTVQGFHGKVELPDDLLKEIRGFVVERLRNYYGEQGFSTELVNAALASPWGTLPDLDSRLRSLDRFMGGEAAASLAASNKRIGNILRKASFKGSTKIEEELFVLDEEKALFEAINDIQSSVEPLLSTGDYQAGLDILAKLRGPVDRFFDAVMVMDEDPSLRNNRLALLAHLKGQFDRIADLSVLG